MTPETRNLRPFVFLFAGMIAWWFVPAALRRAIYEAAYEFEAPAFVLSSRMSDLARYWELRSRSKDDLIRAGRDASRLAATMQYEIAANSALREENARLETLLGLPSRPEYRTVPARTAQRRLGMWWQQIVLRRGKKDGIRPGCPVVNAYGVVGRVRDVFSDTCVVELISSPSFRISAMLSAGGEKSAVTYQGAGATPFSRASGRIGDIPAEAVFPDDGARVDVVTSGLGGIFPAGLKIGSLAGPPARSEDGVFREAVVEPAQNLSSVEEAAILVPVNPDVLEAPASVRAGTTGRER